MLDHGGGFGERRHRSKELRQAALRYTKEWGAAGKRAWLARRCPLFNKYHD